MEIKKYYIILIASFLLSNTLDEYTVSFYGVPMASVKISSTDTLYNKIPATKLIFKTETNNFASKFFKIDNMYQTIIDNSNFNILAFEIILGSASYIPLTSVHISNLFALIAAAIREAVVSLPPRLSKHGILSRVVAM